MIDLKGQVIKHRKIVGNDGDETRRISVSDLNQGTYVISIQGNQFDKQAKLTIAK